jgi:hypothetical protein
MASLPMAALSDKNALSDRRQMVFERIESLKREYTDKYVVVDASRPELARFDGQVGVIKTVNMNGRALVEFQDYIANIGWYDIDLDFLKVVAKPEPAAAAKVEKPAAKKAEPAEKVAAKPASAAATAPAAKKAVAPGEKKLSPLELARMQGAVKRDGGTGAPAKPQSAVPKAAESAQPAASGMKKPTTAEILAAARTRKAPAADPAALAAPPAIEPAAVSEHAPVAVEPAAALSSPKAADALVSHQKLSTTAEKIAWCRANDAGRSSSG